MWKRRCIRGICLGGIKDSYHKCFQKPPRVALFFATVFIFSNPPHQSTMNTIINKAKFPLSHLTIVQIIINSLKIDKMLIKYYSYNHIFLSISSSLSKNPYRNFCSNSDTLPLFIFSLISGIIVSLLSIKYDLSFVVRAKFSHM